MEENDIITEYNAKVLVIANESFFLGKKIKQEKLVRKILRSLSSKFHTKKTTIEESRDLTTMKFDELTGSLCTYEMGISEDKEKIQSIVFLGEVAAHVPSDVHDGYEAVVEFIAMFTKNMGRSVDQLKKKWASQFKAIKQNRGCPKKVPDQTKGEKNDTLNIQGFECGEIRHIESEYADALKKQKKNKSYNATLSDEETNDSKNEAKGANVVFTRRIIQEQIEEHMRLLAHKKETNLKKLTMTLSAYHYIFPFAWCDSQKKINSKVITRKKNLDIILIDENIKFALEHPCLLVAAANDSNAIKETY